MRYLLGTVTGIILASACHAFARTRTYSRILWWASTRDVRHSDPHLYGWGRG